MNKIVLGLLLMSLTAYAGVSTFQGFEGTYKVTEPSGPHGEYSLLTLKDNQEVVYQTYNSHGLVAACLGIGKMVGGFIKTDLVCDTDGVKARRQFSVDIDSSIAFYDLKFDPDAFLALTYTEVQGSHILKKQEYFERVD